MVKQPLFIFNGYVFSQDEVLSMIRLHVVIILRFIPGLTTIYFIYISSGWARNLASMKSTE